MIPKIIHQIWYQGIEEIPVELKEKSDKIKEFHSSWEYIFWDENSIENLVKDDKNVMNVLNNFEYLHQKIDFAKYIILERYGGVYIDMDVNILKSFDELVELYGNYEVILSSVNMNAFENYMLCRSKNCLNNGIIISQTNSAFMQELINYVLNNASCQMYDLNKSICINRTTGPLMVNTVYHNYKNKNNIKVLDWSYLEPCTINNCDIRENTIAVHEHNATWINKYVLILANLYFKHKLLFFAVLIILLIILFQIGKYVINYIKR